MSTKLNKIKCAVFDLDGTLLNTIKTINYYLNFALAKNGLGGISEQDCLCFVGDGAVKLIERALDRLGAECGRYFSSVFADYNEAYNSDPYYLTEPYAGIKELLCALKRSGVALAVLSNKPDFATGAAVSHFFHEIFDMVLGAREGVPLKPSPDSLLTMLSELGFDPIETAYIGDSEPDIETALRGKVALQISVSWGFRTEEQLISAGAKIIVRHPLDVADILIKK